MPSELRPSRSCGSLTFPGLRLEYLMRSTHWNLLRSHLLSWIQNPSHQTSSLSKCDTWHTTTFHKTSTFLFHFYSFVCTEPNSTMKLSLEEIKCPNRFTFVCWHTVYYFICLSDKHVCTDTLKPPVADAGRGKGNWGDHTMVAGFLHPVRLHAGTAALIPIVQTHH